VARSLPAADGRLRPLRPAAPEPVYEIFNRVPDHRESDADQRGDDCEHHDQQVARDRPGRNPGRNAGHRPAGTHYRFSDRFGQYRGECYRSERLDAHRAQYELYAVEDSGDRSVEGCRNAAGDCAGDEDSRPITGLA